MVQGIEQWSNCGIVAGNTQHGKITTIHGATLLPPTSNIVAGNSCLQQCCLVYVGLYTITVITLFNMFLLWFTVWKACFSSEHRLIAYSSKYAMKLDLLCASGSSYDDLGLLPYSIETEIYYFKPTVYIVIIMYSSLHYPALPTKHADCCCVYIALFWFSLWLLYPLL